MQGSVVRLFLKPEHGLPMREVQSVSAIAGQGIEGDAAFGRSSRQVLLVDQAVLEEFDLEPGQTRENVVLSGLKLDGVAIGARLRIGDAVLVVTSDGTACGFMDSIRPGLRQAIRGRRGLLARVERGGVIRVSDPVTLETDRRT